MAQIYSNISIVCFFMSAAFFIVTIVIFFAFRIMDIVREVRGQSQIKWVLSKEKQKKTKRTQTEKGQALSQNETATEFEKFEEEVPTTMGNGDIKMESLVGFYEDRTELEYEGQRDLGRNGAGSTRLEQPTDMAEESREAKQEDPDTEEPTGQMGTFLITESILLVHTDEVI